jgi:hypothetical protein
VAYNFHIRKNIIKLLMEYESVTQNVLFSCRINTANTSTCAPFLACKMSKQYSISLQIISHENLENNLESHCKSSGK